MKIIETGDGSNTIFLEDLNETYHSKHGAIQESNHVFLKNGFRYLLSEQPYKNVQVFELGFGTGLNAVLTALDALRFRIPVNYTSIEPYPISLKIIDQLNYAYLLNDDTGKNVLKGIHNAAWGDFIKIHSFFKIRKINTTIQEYVADADTFDLVYFDAFAPNKQPEIWHKDNLRKVFNILKDKSVFVTYCAQGQLKRDLKEIGFNLQTLQGPPGKKEMIRGIKN